MICADAHEKSPFVRMKFMCDTVHNYLDDLNPDCVVIEGVQYQKNQAVYSQLSQLQGCLFYLFFTTGKPFRIVEPKVWKSFAGIKGRKREEQKASALSIVHDQFKIDVAEDTAEAILIGWWATNHIKERN